MKIFIAFPKKFVNSNFQESVAAHRVNMYQIFKEYCLEEYNDYIDLFENIKIVNPEDDYDESITMIRCHCPITTIYD